MVNYYSDEVISSNVTYGLIGKGIISNRKLADLSSYTVIIAADEFAETTLMRNIADTVLMNGCKNVTLCGEAAEDWQYIFDQEDREINGFNEVTGYEDFAVIKRVEDAADLPEEISMCWNEVIVLCDNMSTLKACQSICRE